MAVWSCSLAEALVKGVLQPLTVSAAPSWVEDVACAKSGTWAWPAAPGALGMELEAHQVQQQAQMGPGPQGWVGDTAGCGCPQGGPRIPWSTPPDSMG